MTFKLTRYQLNQTPMGDFAVTYPIAIYTTINKTWNQVIFIALTSFFSLKETSGDFAKEVSESNNLLTLLSEAVRELICTSVLQ